MAKREALTDEQWAIPEPLIPKIDARVDGLHRAVTHSDRAVLKGFLWVLRTGAGWADMTATFVVAKKGGFGAEESKRGKVTKFMVIADAAGLPLPLRTASASPHEVTLVEATLDGTLTLGRP